ncbi:transposable element Tcb2 transposase [Trichonephila clavipes]|nr:transposable element Tcb2 transposase [Trichonephila clavipes]
MDWPARSSDLNPIEHVWDFLGRRLAARTLPPVTIRELRLALQDEWAAMPQQLIDTLILSMGRRCETCLAVREIISPTKDRMFLAGHPSQGCFGLQSHCAPCYFFNQASFIPLISLLEGVGSNYIRNADYYFAARKRSVYKHAKQTLQPQQIYNTMGPSIVANALTDTIDASSPHFNHRAHKGQLIYQATQIWRTFLGVAYPLLIGPRTRAEML